MSHLSGLGDVALPSPLSEICVSESNIARRRSLTEGYAMSASLKSLNETSMRAHLCII